mgnify:CR=1 FL=1
MTDLAEFQNWLIDNYNVTPRTACVYTSKIRSILTQNTNISTESLQRFIRDPENQSSRDLYLTAWKRFVRFFDEEKHIELPLMKRPNRRRKTSPPPCVLDLAFYLREVLKIPYYHMEKIQWKHVEPTKFENWGLRNPENDGHFAVPSEIFQRVCFWCFRDDEIISDSYIIPLHPGKSRPLSRTQISSVLQGYEPKDPLILFNHAIGKWFKMTNVKTSKSVI